MRFKVDENLHPEVVVLLRDHQHDAVSVWDQKLQGSKDPQLASLCRDERRILLTFDVGFGDIRQYPPLEWPGRGPSSGFAESHPRGRRASSRDSSLFDAPLGEPALGRDGSRYPNPGRT